MSGAARSPLAHFVVVLGLGASLLISGCAGGPRGQGLLCTLDASAHPGAPSTAPRILAVDGETLHMGVEDDPQVQAYLNTIAEPIRRAYGNANGYPRVQAVLDDGYNAWATSDHVVNVSTQALRQAGSDDEVAALVAHEIGHVACDHEASSGEMTAATWTLGLLAHAALYTGVVRGAAGIYVGRGANDAYAAAGFTREQEVQADLNGADAMVRAGDDVEAFAAMLGHFPGGQPVEYQSIFAGPQHPTFGSRYGAISAYLRKRYPFLPQPSGGDRGLARLKHEREPHWACVERSFAAYRTLGYPFALLGLPQLVHDRAAARQAEQLLRSCSVRAGGVQSGGSLVAEDLPSDLRVLWFARLVLAEVRARQRAEQRLPLDVSAESVGSVIIAPNVPQYVLVQSVVLASRLSDPDTATRLLAYMKQQYGLDSRLYPMEVALDVWNYQVRYSRGEWQMPRIVGVKCVVVLDPELDKACQEASRNPRQTLDRYWEMFNGNGKGLPL